VDHDSWFRRLAVDALLLRLIAELVWIGRSASTVIGMIGKPTILLRSLCYDVHPQGHVEACCA